MPIRVRCPNCERGLRVADKHAGRRVKCPGCGEPLRIPQADGSPEDSSTSGTKNAPRRRKRPAANDSEAVAKPSAAGRSPSLDDWFDDSMAPSASAPKMPPRTNVSEPPPRPVPAAAEFTPPRFDEGSPSGAGHYAYFVLLLALVPLVMHVFSENDLEQRLKDTFLENADNEEVLARLTNDDFEGVLAALPDHKIKGALLARDTTFHYGLALLSAGGFLGLLLLFARGGASPGRLIGVVLFTGIVGILMLLAFQWIAFKTLGVFVRGRGIVVLLFYIVKFIGFSYYCAINPEYSFWPSFFGYTFGVGLCEELVKALPIVWYLKTDDHATWRTTAIVGLASGIGFGVSEGITYSGDMYNGLMGGQIYAVRFISCVALHAIWACTVSLLMYRNQDFIHGEIDVGDVLQFVAIYLGLPMILHGLYDVLLKSDMSVWALVVAGVSFAAMAVLVELSQRDFGEAAATA